MCLGVPGRVTLIVENPLGMTMGKVDFAGITKEVCLAYLPDVKVGDYVLVHVGFALSRIDEEEAANVFKLLEEIGQLSELEDQGGDDGRTRSNERSGLGRSAARRASHAPDEPRAAGAQDQADGRGEPDEQADPGEPRGIGGRGNPGGQGGPGEPDREGRQGGTDGPGRDRRGV